MPKGPQDASPTEGAPPNIGVAVDMHGNITVDGEPVEQSQVFEVIQQKQAEYLKQSCKPKE